MKKLIAIATLTALLYSAAADARFLWFGKKKEPTVVTKQEITTDTGDVMVVELTGKEYADVVKYTTDASARTKCFENLSTVGMDSHAQVVREVGLLMGKGINCGAGVNDVGVAVENRKARQTEARSAAVSNVIGTIVGGGVKAVAIGTAGDVLEAGLDRAGNQTTVADGSTFQGAQGEGASYVEQQPVFSGIPTDTLEIEPVTLDTPEELEEPEVFE